MGHIQSEQEKEEEEVEEEEEEEFIKESISLFSFSQDDGRFFNVANGLLLYKKFNDKFWGHVHRIEIASLE